jgi:hypothetical protein
MKLTPSLLNTLVKEELQKLREEKKAKLDSDVGEDNPKEVDADEYADSLEKKIDYIKALKIEEARLTKRLKKVQEQRRRILEGLKK